MRKTIDVGNNKQIIYSVGEDSRTLSQKIRVWYKKGKLESECIAYDRSDALKTGFPKLKKDMINWGISEGKFPMIIGQITEEIETWPEEEIVNEGINDNITAVIHDILLELVYEYGAKGDKENGLWSDKECMYVGEKDFNAAAEEISGGGCKAQNIRIELKHRGFLKTNTGRCTYQKHVRNKLERYITIYWEEIKKELTEEITGEEAAVEVHGEALETERKRVIRGVLKKMCGNCGAGEESQWKTPGKERGDAA